jgi:ribosome biogenesis GTPase
MNSLEFKSVEKQLTSLGFSKWCQENYITLCTKENFSFARIIEVNRGNYKISNGIQESIAELSGKFLFNVENSLDYPTVGDWVFAQLFDDSIAIIHTLLPRKSVIKRLDPGKGVKFQLIASNIDYAFIVQSVNANFDINRLERYLVMVNESGITPIILLTKLDLITDEQLNEITDQFKHYREMYKILPISNITGTGLQELKEVLISGKTYSLLGSSGVGKTTLLNNLMGEQLFDVKEIREKDDKGKHTTTKRQLVCLDSGAIFIDTPGMRELGNFDISTGIEETFDRISYYTSQCRFNDCTHTTETGCAVLAAVENGDVSEDQYGNFMKLRKEAAFYEMSAYDKRHKDKKVKTEHRRYKKIMRKK